MIMMLLSIIIKKIKMVTSILLVLLLDLKVIIMLFMGVTIIV